MLERMSLDLRPMTEADLPLVEDWLRRPHVARWWTRDSTAEAQVAKYRERIARGGRPGRARSGPRMLTVSRDGTPIGWCQWYRWADHREAAEAIGAGPPRRR